MSHRASPFSRLLLLSFVIVAAAAVTASAAESSDQQLRQLRQKRASYTGGADNRKYARLLPLPYKRSHHPQQQQHVGDPDPALEGMTMEELYRMVELLDLVKAGREDKLTPEEMAMLEMLLAQYESQK